MAPLISDRQRAINRQMGVTDAVYLKHCPQGDAAVSGPLYPPDRVSAEQGATNALCGVSDGVYLKWARRFPHLFADSTPAVPASTPAPTAQQVNAAIDGVIRRHLGSVPPAPTRPVPEPQRRATVPAQRSPAPRLGVPPRQSLPMAFINGTLAPSA